MRILGRYEGPHAFGFAGDRFGVWDFGAKVRSAAGFRGTMQASSPTDDLRQFASIGKVSSRRGEGIPPYGLFYYLLRTIKCSVGNGFDRSETLFYMP